MKKGAQAVVGSGLVVAGILALACGEGRPNVTATSADVVSVHLSAGTPIQGATVTVYAIFDSTGAVATQFPVHGGRTNFDGYALSCGYQCLVLRNTN